MTPTRREATGRIHLHPGGSGTENGRLLRYCEVFHTNAGGAQRLPGHASPNLVARCGDPR
jgi:hypothetical protein